MKKIWFITVILLILLSGCSLFEHTETNSLIHHGAKGAKVLIDNSKLRNVEYKGLKKITVRSMSKAEFNELQIGESIAKIKKKYGTGIVISINSSLGENNNAHVTAIIDYPSVEFKGKKKIVLLFYDSKLDSKYFKHLNWKATDFDSRYKNNIDDSKVEYY